MAQYEIKFKIFGEYPSVYDGVCQVELSDKEVHLLIALMQKHNTTDVEKLKLEANLSAVYEKIREACDEVAINIVEEDWLRSAFWHQDDYNYDLDELILHCQGNYGCPSFDEDDNIEDRDSESDDIVNINAGHQYEDFFDWLCDFWKTASIEELKDLCFNYMGFDDEELCETICCVGEQYEIALPQAIVEMANLKNA